MKTALVCGAGGFIGGHLVKKLKREGYWVRGVDVKEHEFAESAADEFRLLDLREAHNCWEALSLGNGKTFDEVYQLAADMGGMGFIHSAECDIMRNSALINNHMIDAATRIGVGRYFFSSSACVYPDMAPGDPAMTEDEVVPANPDNEYGRMVSVGRSITPSGWPGLMRGIIRSRCGWRGSRIVTGRRGRGAAGGRRRRRRSAGRWR
jgi:nucleoside-diphosphate-sugar epimerase